MRAKYVSELADRAFSASKTEAGWGKIRDICHQAQAWPDTAAQLEVELELDPLFQALLASHLGFTPSKWLLERELDEVAKRRQQMQVEPVEPGDDAYQRAAASGLMGLCFSGGGIRSATFNLGILQGLAELKMLHCFDYLSSVSGGGYIHEWLASWGKRAGFDTVANLMIPLPEPGSPGTHPEPIRWLRRYANYLTPERGLFTADTWVAITTWVRNTILNQIILVTALLSLMLYPHVLTFGFIERGPGAAVAMGALVYLFLMATIFVGKNLFRFSRHPAIKNGLFGQTGVQLGVVLPLLASSLLFTLLFHTTAKDLFGLHLVLCFFVSVTLLLVLTLTIVFAGQAILCYLENQHFTEGCRSLRKFWPAAGWKERLNVMWVIALLAGAAMVASACGALWIVLTDYWIASLWSHFPNYWWQLTLVIDPPLVLLGPLLAMILLSGLLGRSFEDAKREWLARFGAWVALYSLTWLVFVGFSLFGYPAVTWFAVHLKTMSGALVTWAVTSLAGVLAGKSPKTMGAKDDKAPAGFNLMEIIAIVAPYVFIAGLLLLLSALGETMLRAAKPHGALWVVAAFFVPALICWLFARRVDINEFSLHAFYRDRLARCYLGASNARRDPNPFTGFDQKDTRVRVSDLRPEEGYYGPFPIFCTALNLTFGEDLGWQERKAASFAFTPLYSGYDVPWTAAKGRRTSLRFNGFVKTMQYAYPDAGIHLSTAAAISGAAMSPNWGYHTNPATAFLLTVFNVRLGWWLANPRVLDEDGKKLRLGQEAIAARAKYPDTSPRYSLFYLVKELLGETNDTSDFVYLTDGGHFDNMGLYELVRRRCRYIVICDAEDDGRLRFQGIGMAIRKCRIDFGAEITLDLRTIEHKDDTEYSSAHCVVGTIRYPEDEPDGKPGIVVYIKSSLTGDEPADILNYKKEHPAFPHDSTLNQWFTESQFESYRRLGHHVAMSAFEPAFPRALLCNTHQGRSDFFDNLRNIWSAFTPEMKQYGADHSKRYEELLQEIRTDSSLAGLFDLLFDRVSENPLQWNPNRTPAQAAYATQFSSKLIEFIFIVYMQLNLVLPENLNHPFAAGWLEIFKSWSRIDVVHDAWNQYGPGYTKGFQLFVDTKVF